MSYGASVYSHVYNPLITAKVLCGICREQKSAPSQLEIETQLVMDRLLRECFTSNLPAAKVELMPLTSTRDPEERKISIWTTVVFTH
jgi:hypothetical protein